MPEIRRLLIANRGEIARRIARTCRDMGISTVAVHSIPDRTSPFAREADIAIELPGSSSRETYLDIPALLDAARRGGADAVHPGYGFLAENPDFATAVIRAGLTWVGPGPEAMAAMGDKMAAKSLVAAAGVPVLHDIDLLNVTADEAAVAADRLGYPLLVKAAAGGGGRGMRTVRVVSELWESIESARREALSSFGDERVFLERLLERVRHVEVQVLGDTHGHLVHCFERECSVQRRHQKVIEEAPSVAMSRDLRERMGQAALAAARAVGYVNAGTVEFLVDANGEFFFLEMNTRLQVEHPVTEAIIGRDLVRDQLLIAMGEPLGLSQEDIRINGHAIEVRLYAEDPARDFLPGGGAVQVFEPAATPSVRVDSGVESGTVVSPFYDPMLAKFTAHAPTRREAAVKLATALEHTRIHGLTTNRDFLVAALRHPAFLAGDTTTGFIDEHRPARQRRPSPAEVSAAAVAAALHAAETRPLPGAPAGAPRGWRNNPAVPQSTSFEHGDESVVVRYQRQRDGRYDCAANEQAMVARVRGIAGDRISLSLDGVTSPFAVYQHGPDVFVQDGGGEIRFKEIERLPEPNPSVRAGGYTAPMPGKVVSVQVSPGTRVQIGDPLLVLEAMKMEHRMTALADGVVADVRVQPGQQVDVGEVLVVMADS